MAARRGYRALLVWVVPPGLLLAGHWPFGLAIALLVTVWTLSGTPPDGRDDRG
jgi:hypothetical protein